MNTTNKTFTLIIATALLLIAACQNASDDTDPGIFDLRVNGVIDQIGLSEHQLGTIAMFEMNLSDNRDLAEFQVDLEGELDYTENLEGSTATVTYDLTVDADTYTEGDTVRMVFIVEDNFGNIAFRPHAILVAE